MCGPPPPTATRLHPAPRQSSRHQVRALYPCAWGCALTVLDKAKKKRGIGERSEARRTEGDGSGELAAAQGVGNKGSERSTRTRGEGGLACCMQSWLSVKCMDRLGYRLSHSPA